MLSVYYKSFEANDVQDLLQMCKIVVIQVQSRSVINVIHRAGCQDTGKAMLG